ncbi:FAD-dependent monooxygenase [Streptomyces sp. 142MFCol3.1]|uniref:FAD-dependent monooxygenase n=1 Tax=Streptomyces sp. 142MFCol3.1 TaxID=1172179 RepID=UPI003B638A76
MDPVVIVGGGPVGLTTSLLLSDLGVPNVPFERHQGTSIHPKAIGLNQRTIEIFRRLGLQKPIDAAAAPPSSVSRTGWYTSLAGPSDLHGRQITNRDAWGGGGYAEEYAAASPAPYTMLPQIRLAPILRAAAEGRPNDTVRFNAVAAIEQERDRCHGHPRRRRPRPRLLRGRCRWRQDGSPARRSQPGTRTPPTPVAITTSGHAIQRPNSGTISSPLDERAGHTEVAPRPARGLRYEGSRLRLRGWLPSPPLSTGACRFGRSMQAHTAVPVPHRRTAHRPATPWTSSRPRPCSSGSTSRCGSVSLAA